jgi:hypothetical protein
MSNINYLWTGESVFCKCGHHLEYHDTTQSLTDMFTNELNIKFRCNYQNNDLFCCCKGFRAYRKMKNER